jgi:pSer/pThr/pTyr-binding forkhead associated (FHA) protein
MLITHEGPEGGRCYPLTLDLVSLGRDDTCTYQVLDPLVSRTHLQILKKDGRHFAADYRTLNGVFVNDQRVIEPVPLADGDRIRLGGTTLVYQSDETSRTVSSHEAAAAFAKKKKNEWATDTLARPR